MLNQDKYCEKCGFKNKQNDKFCGGCGKDFNFKPKKKRNWAEFFFGLGFFIVWANLFSPTMGFDLSGSDTASGTNFGMFVWYVMYIWGGIATIVKGVKKNKLINDIQKQESNPFPKRNLHLIKVSVIVLISIVIIALTVSYSINSARKNNPDFIFKDAIYGTNLSGGSRLGTVMGEVFKGYREAALKKFPASTAIDSSNILEFDSYESKTSLQNSISMLKAGILELEKSDQLLKEIKEEARNKIRNSDLSESDKASVLSGFNESTNDTDQIYATQRRYETLRLFYKEVLELYQFLLINFSDYQIGFDENNEEQIYFKSDKNIDIYNQHSVDIQKASLRFLEAEKYLKDIVDARFKKSGLDITSSDILNSFAQ